MNSGAGLWNGARTNEKNIYRKWERTRNKRRVLYCTADTNINTIISAARNGQKLGSDRRRIKAWTNKRVKEGERER